MASSYRPRRRIIAALASSLLLPLVGIATAQPATATGPWVVTVGDSYISGEAGRWAGNSNVSPSYVDALGSDAYYDNETKTAEQIVRCHRSESAEAYIGGGINGINLACSGAKTSTYTSSEGYFKPGIDFYSSGGRKGQALMLQEFAAGHDVDMVVVSIGGNDFNFASIVQTCVTNWLTSPSWWPNYCYDDSSVASNFTSANVTAQTTKIKNALLNVQQAMANAGYAAGDYTILVQTYPSPLPDGAAIRYSQSGWSRQSVGGCGFWNKDADWANSTALPKINGAVREAVRQSALPNVKVLELTATFNGRRLCENTVGLLEEKGFTSWQQPGAVDATEWISQIRTVTTVTGPYYVQESFHPNYWGQLALRNCVRQAYNNGVPRGGACTIAGTGLNNLGEPKMQVG